MRADNANFSAQNSAKAKAPRIVVQIAFNTASTDLYYLTSHADAALPAGAVATLSCVKGVSGTSQRLNPDQARAEIGAFNIDVTDKGRAITTLMFAKLGAGDGLKGKRVRVYVGYQGLAWAEYVLVGTQIVQGIAYDRGLYTFSCADVLRETRKDIFDLKTTKITATITATMDVIAVISTTGFETVAHGVSYSDAPSATVGYLRIDDEIIRYTGKTANTFTGCVRGALNTLAVDHVVSAGASNDRLPTVSEYVYLEMPAPKLALALLTGSLYGQASNLPANWHLGINAAYVRTADFTAIGADWWDAANDLAGLPVRFEGLQKTDGKKFIEEQLYLLLGAFSPVYADGSLGLRRMTKVLASSGYVAHLTASDIVSASALTHDLAAVINQVDIAWNWNAVQKRFTRRNTLIDAQSISTHGLAAPKKLEMRGLHGSIHSYTTLQSRFDSLRDRYAGPPERLRVQALHKWNTLEVGDTVRVTLDQVRDFPTGANLDRTFEVQSAQPDWVTGQVWLDLFGSSQPAGTVAWGGPAPVLANSYYTSAGTPLTSILTISVTGGVGHVTANGNLNGSATTSGAIYYYDGDLTIDTGKLITFTNNVQLRVKGHLTINGTLDGKGSGLPGAPENASVPAGTAGTPGWLGPTQAMGGRGYKAPSGIGGSLTFPQFPAPIAAGKHVSFPDLSLSITGAQVVPLPDDLRGTSGGAGGTCDDGYHIAPGSAGGSSGAGLLIICRGASFGAAGKITVDGNDGLLGKNWQGTYTTGFVGGSGGGGAPGAVLILLDGGASNYPDFNANTFSAKTGRTPKISYPRDYPGLYADPFDMSKSAYKIQYLPDIVTAENDPSRETVQPPTGLTLASGDAQLILAGDGTIISRISATWTASPDVYLKGHRVEYKRSADSVWTEMSSITPKGTNQQYIAPVQDGVAYDVRVQAISKFGIESAWVTVTGHIVIGKSAPPANVGGFTAQFTSSGIKFVWNGVADKDLKEYVIRVGAAWATGTQVVATRATNYLYEFKVAGNYTFWVAALDTSGNYSTAPTSVAVQINAPAVPALTTSISGPDVFFSWDDPVASLPIVEYDLSYGDVFATRTYYTSVKANSTKVRINWTGSRRWWLEARDAAGNMGAAASADVSAVLPAMPSLRAEVVDHQVQLYFSSTQGSLPIVGYRLRKGATLGGATLLGDIDGTFKLLMELVSGTYTYWCSALDSAGNEGPAASLAVRVDPPPDFVLKSEFKSTFTGTKNNCGVMSNGQMLAAINTAETWDSHFTSRGWTTPNAQVLAGFPIYAEPSATTGFYEESWDTGAIIAASLVSATITSAVVAGSITITPTLSVRALATDPWTDYAGKDNIYAQNFRYVKIRYDFASVGGDDLSAISAMSVLVKVKLTSDAGKFTAQAGDVGGTQVLFTKSFVDIQSINVQPYTTTKTDTVVDFTDAPNPTGFKVLVFDKSSGVRLTVPCGWSAEGYING